MVDRQDDLPRNADGDRASGVVHFQLVRCVARGDWEAAERGAQRSRSRRRAAAPEVYAEQVAHNATWRSWTGLLRDDGMALDSLNQFFTLDILFHYTMYNKEEIDRSFYYDIALRGRDSSDDEWTLMTSSRRFRRLFCKIGRQDCFGIAVLHQVRNVARCLAARRG